MATPKGDHESNLYACALCGFTIEAVYEVQPTSITEDHIDPRDGLVCLRGRLEAVEA